MNIVYQNTQNINTRLRHDIEDLKARVDLRQLAADLRVRVKKRHTKYDQCYSPLRNDGKNASFAVYSDRFKDFGGSQECGDHIDLIQAVLNCMKREAINYLADYAGNAPLPDKLSQPVVQTAYCEPPNTLWQNAALTMLEKCQRWLWSNHPEARHARAYLNERGLSDDTLRAAGIGFCPRWMKINWRKDDGKPARMSPGIVIPIFYNGTLWALRVREFHQKMSDKYLNVAGSKLTGALFAGDVIQMNEPLLMVEGEFDAMLAGQYLNIPVITSGPVSNTPQRRQLDHIRRASVVYILMDNDEPGQGAAQTWAAAIGDKARILPALPAGKDVTEYICEHNGDLAAWFQVVTRRVPFPAGVPDNWRSVLMNRAYFPDSFAVGVELLNEGIRAGYIDRDRFIIADLLTANRELQFNLSESTIRKLLSNEQADLVKLEFLRLLDGKEKTQYTNRKNPDGRPPDVYALTDPANWSKHLLDWVAPRVYEQAHKDTILAKPTAAMMRDSGVSEDATASTVDELDAILKPSYKLQDDAQVRTSKRARCELVRISESLKDPHSSPLPDGWPLNKARAYRRAFAHVVAGGGQRTRRELCRLLGVSNSGLSDVLKEAGIEQIEQFEQAELNVPSQQLEQELDRIGRYEVSGMPDKLIAKLPSGKVVDCAISRDKTKGGAIDDDTRRFYAEMIGFGAKIEGRFRVASQQKIVRTMSPEPSVIARREKPTLKTVIRPPKGDTWKLNLAPRQRHYGPTYDPAWLAAQYWLALQLLGWMQRGRDMLINPDTGELAYRDTTPCELLQCVLGRTITRSDEEGCHVNLKEVAND